MPEASEQASKPSSKRASTRLALTIRAPRVEDGAAMWSLVHEVGTLDTNSAYLYLLLADRFADTCAVAERDGRLVAMLTGFVPPRDPVTYFVWQIGVDPSARGEKLASRLIDHVLARHPAVSFLEATVSPSNDASLALFRSFAQRRDAPLATHAGYGAELFPHAPDRSQHDRPPHDRPQHEAEPLLRIGPFASCRFGAGRQAERPAAT
jgi:diaminobutyrate acetyltransferase